MTPAPPTVSVIIATFNRSRVLRHAIQSVRDSSFTDWELIVVGDACSGDTAECVTSFNDPRLRFVNLPNRCGDQSGPHNHAIGLSRGRYIAFLNHDDVYLPDHLALCVKELASDGADLVWVPCAVAAPIASPIEGRSPVTFSLSGVPSGSRFSPFSFYFASSWVFRRDLAERVGPWSEPGRLYVTPSQDWLFRAWRSGARLKFIPKVSVLVVPAGPRPDCYARRESPEHEWIAQMLRDDPKFLERIFEEAAISAAGLHASSFYYPTLRTIRRMMLRPVYAALIALGIHPQSLPIAILHAGRGGQVQDHRRKTGAG